MAVNRMKSRSLSILWHTYLLFLGTVFLATHADASELVIPYEVVIEGVADGALLEEMKHISDAVGLKDHPPASLSLLRRRMDRDCDQFQRLLRSWGHYGGQVQGVMETQARPVQVIFRVQPGPAYTLKAVDFRLKGDTGTFDAEMPEAQEVGLSPGEVFKAQGFLDAQKRLLTALGRKGYPFAGVPERKVVVDHASHSVSATIWIDPGPRSRFGPVEITGLTSVVEPYVRTKIPWQEGDLFDVDLLEKVQKRLGDLGLFSTVRVSSAEIPDEKGEVPVHITVTERKHRSVGAGVSYKTDEGPGVRFSWEHRNLLGAGERLSAAGTVSDLTYSAEAGFREPHFMRNDQNLTLGMRLAEDKPDAYTSRNLATSALLDRDLTKTLKVGGGVGFKRSRITQLGETESYSLVSLPFQLALDRSDNLMDPSKGGRLGIKVTPFYDLDGDHVNFVKASARYGHYLKVLESPSTVLAGRIGLGVLSGAERLEIPADERLYAGGGGSIRGYAYQSVGPRVGAVPTGGKSLFEVSVEARTRITESLGLVWFVDGGSAFQGITPTSEEKLLWGGGMGVRYFTGIGPFRFDVAVPFNPRDDLDDPFQIYVSLGQAF